MASDAQLAEEIHKYSRKLLHRAAECNGLPLLQSLLSESTEDVDIKDDRNCTPLLLAVLHNKGTSHQKTIELLLSSGANVNAQDSDGNTALHHFSNSLEIVNLLLSAGADVNVKNNHSQTSLFDAVNDEVFQLLLDRGADVDVQDESGESVLHAAASKNDLPRVIKLLASGAKVDSVDGRNETPLITAARKNDSDSHYETIDVLLKNGADVNAQDLCGLMPLHYLLENVETVALLLKYKPNVNLKDDYGRTTLKYALEYGGAKIMRLFADHEVITDLNSKWNEPALHRAAINNDATQVKRFLSLQGIKVDLKDAFGRTSLHMAAFRSKNDWYLEVVQVLLKNGANVNVRDDEGKTALHYLVMSASNVETVRLFLNHKADVNVEDSKGQTPLILSKDEEVVQLLSDWGADVNAVDGSGQTALHEAVKKNNLPKIIKLISLGADLNARDVNGRTALYLTTKYRTIELLLINNADVNVQNNEGKSLLHDLILNQSDVQTIQLLLDSKADVNSKDDRGRTPLITAVESDSEEIAQLLIDNGADISTVNYYGKTALHKAAEKNNASLIRKLISLGADVDTRDDFDCTPLHLVAAYHKNTQSQCESIEVLLESGADVSAQNGGGETPIFCCVNDLANGKTVETLLYHQVDVNIDSNEGKTPLLLAVSRHKNSEITRLLLNHGADVSYTNPKDKTTLLHVACQRFQNFCTLELLLKKGLDVNARDAGGKTALHHLVKNHGLVDTVQLLLNFGADMNVKDKEGNSPFFAALEYTNDEVIQLMIERGAKVNDVNYTDESTPLHIACVNACSFVAIELLLKNGADVNAQDHRGETPLHYLTRTSLDRKAIIEMYLTYDPDIHIQDSGDRTALVNSIDNWSTQKVRLLIEHDPECMNVKMDFGKTTFHLACEKFCFDTMKLMIERGFDVNTQDDWGRTALHYAVRKGDEEIVELLLGFGADGNLGDQDGETALHEFCESYFDYHDKKSYLKLLKRFLKLGGDTQARNSMGRTPLMNLTREMYDDCVIEFLLKYHDMNRIDEDVMESDWPKPLLEHLAKLQILELELDSRILETISSNEEFEEYVKKCVDELMLAKSCKLKNSWVTFFNLLVDDKKKLKNYAGNRDLVKDFKRSKYEQKFPIYCKQMRKYFEKGLKIRELYDKSAVMLSKCWPIFNPTHLVVRDVLDCVVNTKDLRKFCMYVTGKMYERSCN